MIKQDLHILMLEDDSLDADLNKEQLLLLEEYNCLVDLAMDKMSYLKAIDKNEYDIILSDYNLPQYNGLEALNDLKKRNPFIPFIFVTGTIDEETAAGTIKAGAWDYVVKDRLFRLPLAIRGALRLKEERINSSLVLEKNKQLSAAIEQSPVSVIITDIDCKIEYVNTHFTELTGFLSDEIIGKDIIMLFPEGKKHELISLFTNNFTETNNWKGEVQSLKKDGSLFWELLSISPLKNEKGDITHIVAIKEDITKRKEMEQDLLTALARAERSDKLKDAFLQNLSHEIRTPLNAIIGFSDLLQSDREKSKNKVDEYAKIISNSSNKLLSIVSDVLTIASIQTGQESVISQLVDINLLFDRLYRIYFPLAKQKNLNFIVYKDRQDLSFVINSDESKLEQIIANLLNNAFKFTHSGTIQLLYLVLENSVEFYVKDTGIGIPKDSLSIIFEHFRQAEDSISTKYGGTGLGLSIAISYARMLGGNITVESELSKGSVFCLTVPYVSFDPKPKTVDFDDSPIFEEDMEILIAEDELNNFLYFESLLSYENVTIHHAYNGLEAIKICEENPSINLVLMDIKMPGMDGATAFLEIRKMRKDLPIIAQTAYALEEEKQHFLKLGFDEYIAKPISHDELILKINKVIKKYKSL